jgi:hypothetical protein
LTPLVCLWATAGSGHRNRAGAPRPRSRRSPSRQTCPVRAFPARRGRSRSRRFDLAGEPVTTRSHHRPTQLVQQRPRRLVAAQAEQPLQAESADAVLCARDIPGSLEPGRQRQPRVGEDRSRRDRVIRAAARTAEIPPLAHPPRLLRHPAAGISARLRTPPGAADRGPGTGEPSLGIHSLGHRHAGHGRGLTPFLSESVLARLRTNRQPTGVRSRSPAARDMAGLWPFVRSGHGRGLELVSN